MASRFALLLVTASCLTSAGCLWFAATPPVRCEDSSTCPSGYDCVDGICQAIASRDGFSLDGVVDARAVADSVNAEHIADDVASGLERRLADSSRDGSQQDTGPPDASMHDTSAADLSLDTGSTDALRSDTLRWDAWPVDSVVQDVHAVDAAGLDHGAADGAARDSATPDVTTLDTGSADTAIPDAYTRDTAGELGSPCLAHLDCHSGFCSPLDGVCREPTCFDGHRNQDETDVDCGGLCVGQRPLCLEGEGCADDTDCETGFCRSSDQTCQTASCDDGEQNQDETGVDCGGNTCGPCPTCWGNAANFEPEGPGVVFSARVDLSGCSPTINTSLAPAAMLSGWCGDQPMPVIQAQLGGPSVVVVPMAGLRIPAGSTLRLIGDKPVVLAVRGDAIIEGHIDAGARGATPGAGGDLSTDGSIATAGATIGTGDCSLQPSGTGQGENREPGNFSIGGGGAGFRTNGGFGGGERPNFRCYSNAPSYTLVANGYECKPLCPDYSCDNSYINTINRYQANNSAHFAVSPSYGLAAVDPSLTPLRGGCAGGRGETRDAATAYYGGSGGGAVQLTVTGALIVGAGGVVSAGGGGGTVVGSHGSGSGGGSGGAILIEATSLDLSAAAGIRAHGGSGGGRDGGGGCASRAEDGHASDDGYATHTVPASCVDEGRGGLSYWNVGSSSCNGTGTDMGSAAACTLPIADWPSSTTAYPQGGSFTDNNGGGGGGGSGGVIVVRRLVRAGAC